MATIDKPAYTPMIMQYLSVKEQAQDAFLFFRLGDFYEMFFDDAIRAARELDITLTGREGGGKERIPMCGVPYHSAEGYISRLIEKGFKVAICEQVEDPAAAKGVVRREIVRVVTPGTVMETKSLEGKSNNFMVAVAQSDGAYALAACDLSTGELYVTSFADSLQLLVDEINVYLPSEIVGDEQLIEALRQQPSQWNRPVVYTHRLPMAQERLAEQYGEAALRELPAIRLRAVSLLTGYLEDTQKRSLGHVRTIRAYEPTQYMILDPFTRRNLELVETVQDRSKKGSLLWLLDQTQTAMGGRLLRRWIDKPLLNLAQIEERLEAVEQLYNDYILREDLRAELKEIYDLERLVGRVAYGNANGRDLIALKTSLQRVPELTERCGASDSATLQRLVHELDGCGDLAELIDTVLVDEPPVSIREGNLIRSGYDDYLDQLRSASTGGKQWLAELERREREATGIRSLKIGYNKVFGYYLEVTKANLPQLPEGRYERKQTLANAERFVTPELKEKERLILEAEDKMVDLEYQRFIELRDHLAAHLHRLQRLAEVIATIDVYQSLASVSAQHRFARPQVTDGYDLVIAEGRHPVVEAVLESRSFIANATSLRKDEAAMLLITGPNMAGKSTYMRQVALICILAQIGCFVPARAATIPLTDRIFTRIGAADDLIGGQSTFMVEMKDIQVMTEKATPRSLIIIDELGRGTSTAEGMAIAQAVIEFVHREIGCKALVSTHFHELAHLEESLPSLANASMAVKESGDDVTFLRKLVPGAASSSYGIYCARLAGLPEQIIGRAYELLHAAAVPLDEAAAASETSAHPSDEAARETKGRYGERHGAETGTSAPGVAASVDQHQLLHEPAIAIESTPEAPVAVPTPPTVTNPGSGSGEVVQLSMFGMETAAPAPKSKKTVQAELVAEQLRQLDLFNLTPMQAMQWLNDMKKKLAESAH